MEEILRILHECHLNNDESKEISNINKTSSTENVEKDIEKLLADIRCNIGSIEYANLNKILAVCYLKVLSVLSSNIFIRIM